MGLPVKKTFTYSEKSEEKREEYLRLVTRIPDENRVYADECGIKEHLKREYGCALRGVKVEDVKRGHDFHRVNTAAAVIHGKAGAKKLALLCYHGSMKADRFERWIERDLLKTIIMDNAGSHRKKQLNEICGKAGAGLLFLPHYSPDFNPIGKDWANMKRDLRDTASMYALLETAIYNYWC